MDAGGPLGGPGDRGRALQGERTLLSPGQGPLAYFFCPKILIKSEKLFHGVSGLFELCRLGFQRLLLFQPEFQLPTSPLFMVNLVK